MIKIRCVVERITYQNQENGYSVMKVKVRDIPIWLPWWETCWMFQWERYCCAMATGRWTSDTDSSLPAKPGKR